VSSMWEILVPTVRNNGKPYRTRHHREWDKRVRRISGGLTILPVSKGQWVSPDGVLFTERMIPVRVVASDVQMEKIIATTFQHYPDQIAVLAYVISHRVALRYRGLSYPAPIQQD